MIPGRVRTADGTVILPRLEPCPTCGIRPPWHDSTCPARPR